MHTGCLTILMRRIGLHLETGEAEEAAPSRPKEGPLYEVEEKDGVKLKARNPRNRM